MNGSSCLLNDSSFAEGYVGSQNLTLKVEINEKALKLQAIIQLPSLQLKGKFFLEGTSQWSNDLRSIKLQGSSTHIQGLALHGRMDGVFIVTLQKAKFTGTDTNGYTVVVVSACLFSSDGLIFLSEVESKITY